MFDLLLWFDLQTILALIEFVRFLVPSLLSASAFRFQLLLLALAGLVLLAADANAQVTSDRCAFGHGFSPGKACATCGYELAPARWRKVGPAESLRLPVPPLFRSFTNLLGVTEVTQWVDRPQKYVNTVSAHVDGTHEDWLKKIQAHLAARGVHRPTIRKADFANPGSTVRVRARS